MTGTLNGNRKTGTKEEFERLLARESTTTFREKAVEVYNTTKPTTVSPKKVARGGHGVACPGAKERRRAKRVSVAELLASKWYVEPDDITENMKVLSVIYVPEGTFKASETKQCLKSRLLVELEAENGNRYMTNIANQMHRLVGYASSERADKLANNMPESVNVVDGDIMIRDIRRWFKNSNL